MVMFKLGGCPPPSAPTSPGASWICLGDSQTAGYGSGSTENPPVAFKAIWDATFTAPTTFVRNGIGGRYLSQTHTYYNGRAERTSATFVYFQESGGQVEPGEDMGQETASDFGDTFDAFIADIVANTPNAVILTETAFSFGREGTAGRNWDTYNDELRSRVAAWEALGTTIYIGEVDRNIKALQTATAPVDVWFQSNESNSYHYKDFGNLMVALTMFDALGYSMDDLDLSGITVPTQTQIDACLAVIASYQ